LFLGEGFLDLQAKIPVEGRDRYETVSFREFLVRRATSSV